MADEAENIQEEKKEAEILPVMPDLGGTSSNKGELSIKTWILVIIVLISILPYYFLYQAGFSNGYADGLKLKVNNKTVLSTTYSEPIYVLDNVEVNLRDHKNPKYLTATINLALKKNTDMAKIAPYETELRDTLIILLSKYKASDLDSIRAYSKLKRLIKDAMNGILRSNIRVTDVYLSKFLIKLLEPTQKIKI